MIDMFLRPLLLYYYYYYYYYFYFYCYYYFFPYLIHTLFLASIRTKHEMTWTTDSATKSHENNEQPSHGGQELPEQLT